MGFFSWTCAKTGESIPAFPHAHEACPHKNFIHSDSDIVVILPEVTRVSEVSGEEMTLGSGGVRGMYDGYGHVGHKDIFELYGQRVFDTTTREEAFKHYDEIVKLIKIVIYDSYNNETWEELEVSQNCPYQGFFYD